MYCLYRRHKSTESTQYKTANYSHPCGRDWILENKNILIWYMTEIVAKFDKEQEQKELYSK